MNDHKIYTKSDIADELNMSLRTLERRIKDALIELVGNKFSREGVNLIKEELNRALLKKVILPPPQITKISYVISKNIFEIKSWCAFSFFCRVCVA